MAGIAFSAILGGASKVFGNVFSFLLQNWKIVLIALGVGYLAWTYFHEIPAMRRTIQTQQAAITAEANARAQMERDFATYRQENDTRLNQLQQATTSVNRAQRTVREGINHVPVTTAGRDAPFSDPGLLERANRLRAYQQTSPANTPAPNTPTNRP